MTPNQNRHHPFVKRCRRLARRQDKESSDILLDGLHLVQEALDARLAGLTVATNTEARLRLDVTDVLRRVEEAGGAVLELSNDAMDAASPVRSPSGIVAIAEFQPASLVAVLSRVPALVVAAVDIQDPGNVGAIIRAAEAAGASGVVVAGQSADPLGWRAIRGSMGSLFRIPVAVCLEITGVLAEARDRHIATYATVPAAGVDLFDSDLTRPLMLLVGAEGAGLDDSTIRACDRAIRIPMAAPVESLNVAVAAGVVLFEARRQRTAMRPA